MSSAPPDLSAPSSPVHSETSEWVRVGLDHLSIIIPAYNEVLTLGPLLRRLASITVPKEIIFVDDGSNDGTREYVERFQANPPVWWTSAPGAGPFKVAVHSSNLGKGAAIRTGLTLATGQVTVIQDADLEYDPRDIPSMLRPILSGEADVVYGSRFGGEVHRVLYFRHALGNKLLTLFSNLLTDLNLTDLVTGYKMFRTNLLRTIPLRTNGFAFEAEITSKLAKLDCRIFEVPISYKGRSYDEGKKTSWRDGLLMVWTLLRFYFKEDLYEEKIAGLRTLRIMEGASAYNRWLFRQCEPYLKQRVLEVGAGVGNITKFLLSRPFVIPTDYSESYATELRQKFGHFPNVHVERLDLLDAGSVDQLKRRYAPDCILSMNMLEHIEDDLTASVNMVRLLPSGGRLVLLVPAHDALFSGMDTSLGHYRRYDKRSLTELLEKSGFKIVHSKYLNVLGAIGWWVNGRVLRRKLIPSRQLRLFDFFIFILALERHIPPPFGLSVLVVAEKQ
jgi:glycosyltransferase involved in cell wall biosynthesis